MTYTIYESRLSEVTSKLDKIATKARKYGVPFSYEVGEAYPKSVAVCGYDDENHCMVCLGTFNVVAVDIEVNNLQLIKANGWTVLAKIEHGTPANVVTVFADCDRDPAWETVPGRCDHCHTNHKRSVTFIVKHSSGETKQVGRSCLKDYTGIDPATAVLAATIHNLMEEDWEISDRSWPSMREARTYEIKTVLAYAVETIEKFGYRKVDQADSTYRHVIDLLNDTEMPSDKALETATDIITWLSEIKENDLTASSLTKDCATMARAGWIKINHVARLAYMPVAYQQYLKKKERDAARQAEAKISEYVGTVGERINIEFDSMVLLTSWDTVYGTTFLYKIIDKSGNILVWYASKPVELAGYTTIKGTVKKHDEYNGAKQTVITRCKLSK